MTVNRGPDVRLSFVERVGLGEDRLTNRPSREAALGGLINHKNDFDHWV